MNFFALSASEIIDSFGAVFEVWGYLIVLIASFMEHLVIFNFFVPGSTVVVVAGFYAATTALDPLAAWSAATLGALLGNHVDYFIGHSGFYRIIQNSNFQKQVREFKKKFVHGGYYLDGFFIYMAGYPRSFLLIALGALRMEWNKFLIFTGTSAAIRKGILILVGYFLGTNREFLLWFIANFWWMGMAALLLWLLVRRITPYYIRKAIARLKLRSERQAVQIGKQALKLSKKTGREIKKKLGG